ncbi:MAG TPA: helix-turn-helix transcriptional regulator [Verrucomicrobiae bacterium]|nr:helix-turn-helix transcriptional regulator [Verrucomicrobiae bacterium]
MNEPLSKEAEAIIGKRLREFRESLKIPRVVFALEIGIGGERLASYESGRVPLRWGVFMAISQRFNLNPTWLATGKQPPRLEGPIDATPFETVDPKKRFSSVFRYMASFGPTSIFALFHLSTKWFHVSKLINEMVENAAEYKVDKNMILKLLAFQKGWMELGEFMMTADQRRKNLWASIAKAKISELP